MKTNQRNILYVLVTVLVVAGLVYLVRQPVAKTVDQQLAPMDSVPSDEINMYPAVLYTVRERDAEPVLYAYHLPNGKLEGPITSWEGVHQIRYNQSSDLCGTGAVTPLTIECEMTNDAVMKMVVSDETDGGKTVLTRTIDPRALGIFPSAAEGYLVPVAVATDKSAIYLGRRVETESYVAGLWRMDVPSGTITEISPVRDQLLYQYDINPATKQLIGVTFTPPASLGEEIGSPSGVHLLDLSTGEGRPLELAGRDVYENPMLSEDGRLYAFYESGLDVEEGPHTIVLTMEYGRVATGWIIEGVLKDWFGDTVIFDRDGNLFLYDLETNVETQLTHETEASVEYLGVVR